MGTEVPSCDLRCREEKSELRSDENNSSQTEEDEERRGFEGVTQFKDGVEEPLAAPMSGDGESDEFSSIGRFIRQRSSVIAKMIYRTEEEEEETAGGQNDDVLTELKLPLGTKLIVVEKGSVTPHGGDSRERKLKVEVLDSYNSPRTAATAPVLAAATFTHRTTFSPLDLETLDPEN